MASVDPNATLEAMDPNPRLRMALALAPDRQSRSARESALRNSRRITPEADLLAELDERLNLLARYQADLAAGECADGDPGQLRGGIEYERCHIELIVSELESRERARAYGYRSASGLVESDLPDRFAAARLVESAAVIEALTGQSGKPTGKTNMFVCPFHGGGRERTPSLTAFPGERGWYCFSCQKGGDAVRFVMEMHAVGAVEALRLLEAGVLGMRVPA